jgi:hypothetical protein
VLFNLNARAAVDDGEGDVGVKEVTVVHIHTAVTTSYDLAAPINAGLGVTEERSLIWK